MDTSRNEKELPAPLCYLLPVFLAWNALLICAMVELSVARKLLPRIFLKLVPIYGKNGDNHSVISFLENREITRLRYTEEEILIS